MAEGVSTLDQRLVKRKQTESVPREAPDTADHDVRDRSGAHRHASGGASTVSPSISFGPNPGRVQRRPPHGTQLAVGPADDPAEREADRVARSVVGELQRERGGAPATVGRDAAPRIRRYWMLGGSEEDRVQVDFSPPISDFDWDDINHLMKMIKEGRVEITPQENLQVLDRIDELEGRDEPIPLPVPERVKSELEREIPTPIELMSMAQLNEVYRKATQDGMEISRVEAVRLSKRLKTLEGLKPLEQYRDEALVSREFVTPEHKNSIAVFCQKKNVILSVRDTGSHSLLRVAEGAKPKPHSILEKSIKESSLKAGGHLEAAEALARGDEALPDIEGVSLSDLRGFVGHWGKNPPKLLGVRVDKRDVLPKSSTPKESDDDHMKGLRIVQQFLEGTDGDSPYVPLARFAEFREALPGGRWKQFLYTGDYDLHEIYQAKKTLAEGTREKAHLLSGLNATIAHEQQKQQGTDSDMPLRKGKIEAHIEEREVDGRMVPASTLHTEEGSQYAMIQHGDQMGYITNQIHEGRLKDETSSLKAQMVGVVASESPSPLAWCVNGDWFVTQNPQEHADFRELVRVRASSGWSKKFQQSLRDGTSRTMEVMTGETTKRGVVPYGPENRAKPGSLAEAFQNRRKRK